MTNRQEQESTTTYNNANRDARQSFLVYINGVEVPAQSISVSMGIWQFPTATVVLPADRLLRRLGYEDRLRVTLFYLDNVYYAKNPQFCLLFDGEITSFSYSNTQSNRTFTLSCRSLGAALEQVKLYFLSNVSNLISKTLGASQTNTPIGAHYKHIFPASLFYKGLDPKSGTPITRPFDFVSNTFRALFGSEDIPPELLEAVKEQLSAEEGEAVTPAKLKSVVALHWFARWARRTNYHKRWVPLPNFESLFQGTFGLESVFPVLAAVQKKNAIDAARHISGRIGDGGSVWEILRQIFLTMYYEVSIISTPACVAVTRVDSEIVGPPSQINGLNKLGELRLTSHVTKPQMLFSVPPACNVIWNSMISSHQYSEDIRNQPTRILISEGNLFNVITGDKPQGDLTELINTSMSAAFPNDARDALDARLGRRDFPKNGALNPHNFLVWPEEFFKGPVPLKMPVPPWFMYLDQTKSGSDVDQAIYAIQEAKTSIVNHLQELIPKLESDSELKKKLAAVKPPLTVATVKKFAKNIQDSNEYPLDLEGKYNQLLDLANLWKDAVRLAQHMGLNSENADTLVNNIVGSSSTAISNNPTYALYAAYEYYRERFSKRNGGCSMVFNPYVVPGYPGVVFDNDELQYHQMMYIAQVSHNMSASGSGTNISYTFARTFNEFFQELAELNVPAFRRPTTSRDNDSISIEVQLTEEEQQELALQTDAPLLAVQSFFIERDNAESFLIGDSVDISDFVLDQRILEAGDLDAAPANAIEIYRVRLQRNENAAEIYERLFWQNTPRANKLHNTIFDWATVLRFAPGGRGRKRITFDKDSNFLNTNTSFYPDTPYLWINKSKDAALDYVSRPICTLDEWMDFQGEKSFPRKVGKKNPGETPRNHFRVWPHHRRQGKGAVYYKRILNLEEAVERPPEKTEQNNRAGRLKQDVRTPWTKLLLQYRERIYERDYPLRA